MEGVTFTSYGPILKDQGFFYLYQLGSSLVQPSNLEKWPGIKPGVAILVLDFAKQGLEATKS